MLPGHGELLWQLNRLRMNVKYAFWLREQVLGSGKSITCKPLFLDSGRLIQLSSCLLPLDVSQALQTQQNSLPSSINPLLLLPSSVSNTTRTMHPWPSSPQLLTSNPLTEKTCQVPAYIPPFSFLSSFHFHLGNHLLWGKLDLPTPTPLTWTNSVRAFHLASLNKWFRNGHET